MESEQKHYVRKAFEPMAEAGLVLSSFAESMLPRKETRDALKTLIAATIYRRLVTRR